MRTRHWMATVASVLAAFACASNAAAQPGMGHGGQPAMAALPFSDAGEATPFMGGGPPGGGGYPPSGPYPHVAPSHSAIDTSAGAMAPGALPWPRISPFENRFEQHYVKDGLWHRRVNNDPRKHWFYLAGSMPYFRAPSYAPIGDGDLGPSLGGTANAGGINKPIKSAGLRGEWGFFEPTGDGFVFDAWWNSDRGRGGGGTGQPVVFNDGMTGTSILMDNELVYDLNAEAAGTAVHWLLAPKLRKGALEIRWLWGMRYVYFKEKFGVTGSSSTNGSFFIEGRTQSQIAGPDMGFRFDLGGEDFKMVGQLTVAVAGNYQDLEVRDVQAAPMRVHALTTTSISPIIEAKWWVEARVFGYLPFFNKMKVLEDAVFRVGFTHLTVAEASRAANSIQYNLTPGQSRVRIDRQKWDTFGWEFGLVWQY